MNYTIAVSETEFAAKLSGDLSFVDHGRFREILERMKETKSRVVVLRIGGVSSIDSAGIGMLLIAAEQAKRTKQNFSVAGANGQVDRIIQLANLGEIIDVTN